MISERKEIQKGIEIRIEIYMAVAAEHILTTFLEYIFIQVFQQFAQLNAHPISDTPLTVLWTTVPQRTRLKSLQNRSTLT